MEHVLGFFQSGWRVCSGGAARMSAHIRALLPKGAPSGCDMECVRCVACATTRQRSAFFSFSLVRSNRICFKGTKDVLSGVHVSRWRFGRPFFHTRWSAAAQIYHLTFLCRNKNAQVALVVKRWLCGVFLCSFAWCLTWCLFHPWRKVSQPQHLVVFSSG